MEIGYYVFAKLNPDNFRSGTKEGLRDTVWQALTNAFVKAEFKWASDISEKGLCCGQKWEAALFNACSLKEFTGCCFFLQLVTMVVPTSYAEDPLEEKVHN